MSIGKRFRVDASPLSLVAANAWLNNENVDTRARDEGRIRAALDEVKRTGARSPFKPRSYRLPVRVWTIVGIALLAWAVIAIPALLIFG